MATMKLRTNTPNLFDRSQSSLDFQTKHSFHITQKMLTFSHAMERFKCFQRGGLIKKAQHLIENIDNVLTCRNIDMRRNENAFFHISTRLKLKMYKHQIMAGSNDPDVRDVVSVAKFLEDNKQYLVDEIAQLRRTRRLEPSDIIEIPDSDSEDELPDLMDLPDIEPPSQTVSQTESNRQRTPVRGIRGFHRYRPYRVSSSAPTPQPTPTPAPTATVTQSTIVLPSFNEESRSEHEDLISRIRQNVRREILQCVICFNKEKDSVLVPCGYFFCNSCARRMKEQLVCGFCRSKINTIAQVRLTN